MSFKEWSAAQTAAKKADAAVKPDASAGKPQTAAKPADVMKDSAPKAKS